MGQGTGFLFNEEKKERRMRKIPRDMSGQEVANRDDKADKIVFHFIAAKITADEVKRMSALQWGEVLEATGFVTISDKTVRVVMHKLRMFEKISETFESVRAKRAGGKKRR